LGVVLSLQSCVPRSYPLERALLIPRMSTWVYYLRPTRGALGFIVLREIYFSVSQEHEMTSYSASASPTFGVGNRSQNTRTFVVVDDSAVIRRRLVSLLSEIEGAQLIGEANNALEGAEMIRDLRPDVVILDIRMPDRSGIGLLEDIKNDPTVPEIIVLTNYPYAAYRKRCLELGASHFFDKSTEFTRLETVVKEMVRPLS